MKYQALFSSKYKRKKLKCRLLQFLFGALNVKNEEKSRGTHSVKQGRIARQYNKIISNTKYMINKQNVCSFYPFFFLKIFCLKSQKQTGNKAGGYRITTK